jgi:hypothetical protein
MGKFSDAWNAGEAEKQAAAEADSLGQEVARQQAQQRGAAEANCWFDDVLKS